MVKAMVGLVMKYSIVISLLSPLLTGSTGADGQVIGKDLCACSPSTYEFTLDFGLFCPPVNVTESDAIDQTSCVITSFGDPNVTDLVPVSVQSIDILELGQGLRVLVQESILGNYSDGDSFAYTSLSATPHEITAPDEVPRAIQINIVGMNQFNEALINVYIITFTNDCGAFPLLLEGQSAGWTHFTQIEPPGKEVCPLGSADVPTGTPTSGILVSADPTQSTSSVPSLSPSISTLSPSSDTNTTPVPTITPVKTSPTVAAGNLTPTTSPIVGTFGPTAPVVTMSPTSAAPLTSLPPTFADKPAPTATPTTTLVPDPPIHISMSLSMSMSIAVARGELLGEFGAVLPKVSHSIGFLALAACC
jgi:hypothetical protein